MEDVHEVLLELVVLSLLAVFFLLLVLTKADTTQLFLRWHAKDLGTLVEAAHGLPGKLELTYGEIGRKREFYFEFLDNAVKATDTDKQRWRVIQYYGRGKEVQLVSAYLELPSVVDIVKEGREVRVAGRQEACAWAREMLLRRQTSLVLQGPQEVRDAFSTGIIAELAEPRGEEDGVGTLFSLTLATLPETTQPEILYLSGPESRAAAGLVCFLQQHLVAEPRFSVRPDSGVQEGAAAITISYHAGQQDAVVEALGKALEELTR